MPRWLQIVLHVLGVAAGAYLSYSHGTPLPAVIASGVSGAIGSISQGYNTDGTPQSQPFPAPPVQSTAGETNPFVKAAGQ